MSKDLLHALRMLRQNPAFTLIAVVCLALGIGVNTAAFSLLNAVFWRPLPVPHAEQLVQMYRAGGNALSFPDYRMILGHAFGLTSVGIGIGSAMSLVAARPLKALVYGLNPADPITLVCVAVTWMLIAGFASCLPARKAAKTESMQAFAVRVKCFSRG